MEVVWASGIYGKAYQTRAGQSSIVATGRLFHNQANVHTTTPALYYVDITRPTIAMEYFVAIGINTTVDTNGACTMTTTVYYQNVVLYI